MNTDTGNIISAEQLGILRKAFTDGEITKGQLAKYREMAVLPTPTQLKRNPPRVGRNEPCPCGSGKKFKKCCYTGAC